MVERYLTTKKESERDLKQASDEAMGQLKQLALDYGCAVWVLQQANAEANPMADVEFKDAALTHREIACNKQITEVSMPSGQDNKTTQFTGVAGSFLLGAGSESDTKGLIDAILDQKVARAALPGNALLTVSAKVAEMVRTLSNGMADGEDAPAKLDVAMHKQGTALNFTFKVGM